MLIISDPITGLIDEKNTCGQKSRKTVPLKEININQAMGFTM
jgi:hypothetical protein